MNLQEIRALIALSQELHFTQAAERLEVSQPQFSQLIRRLQRKLGVTLVERTTRKVTLTDAGLAVLPHAQRALEELKLMQRSARGLQGDIRGTVRLGYAGASSRPRLPQVARSVREQLPGVHLQLQSMVYGAQGPGRIVSGDLDISFSRRPLLHAGLQDSIFEYEELLVGLPSDHPLASSGVINLEDLAHEPWIMFPGAYGSNVRDIGLKVTAEAGFEPKIVQEAPDSYTILGLVAAGVGVTLTVSSVRHVRTPGLTLLPLSGPRRFMAATFAWSTQASQATLAVVDVLKQLAPVPKRPPGIILD